MLEHRFDVFVFFHIAGNDNVGITFTRQFFHAFAQAVTHVGKSQIRAFAVHGLGDAPGNGSIAGDAENQRAFACHESHMCLPVIML